MSAAATKPTGKKRISSATRKTKSAKQPSIDAHQEEIDGLIRERDEIRSKLNSVCLKIMENANSDPSKQQQQQPSDVPLEHLLAMIDEIGHYRTAFLSLSEETEDRRNIPLERKITQLSLDEPDLFRKPLTLDQRLTFVARERDLWKENSQLLQIMYASVVDQLERGLFKRPSVRAVDVLRGHRMNLENVCLVFSSLSARSIKDADKFRPKQVQVDEPVPTHPPADPQETNDRLELPSSAGVKRNVSFADQVHVFDETRVEPERVDHDDHTSHPARASETTIDKMDGNLRMRIIKELSRADHIQRPLSRMSSPYDRYSNPRQPHRVRQAPAEWIVLARLVGIDEAEIEHWVSQSLQYPASRVISVWCHGTTPCPTVADLYRLLSSSELNRQDLARSLSTMYSL